MSVTLGGIDLNSDVSTEQSNEVHGVSVSKSIVRASVSAMETLRVEGVSGGVRVLREAEDSADAFHGTDQSLSYEGGVSGRSVLEGLERENLVVDRVDDIESQMRDNGSDIYMVDLSIPANNVLEGSGAFAGAEIAANGDWAVTELKTASSGDLPSEKDQNVSTYVSGSLIADESEKMAMEVEMHLDTDENLVMRACDSEAGFKHDAGRADMISLIVDLNPWFGEGMDRKTVEGTSNERTEVKEFSGDVGIPFSADNAACFGYGVDLNGSQDVENIERATVIEQSQDTEKKNAIPAARNEDSFANGHRSERKGEFHASDLVWGKVRSHPWWPGQIFDPLDSSEKARKYYKKDGFLIAYFGDQTFAWNEASRIKPFQRYFSKMEKQCNSEAFCHALGCALDEVSRRVELGLACSCLPEEVYSDIKFQIVLNAGIREESSRRDGGGEFSSIGSFTPLNLVQYVKTLAHSPNGGTDGLNFAISQAQLLAFNRWKGYYQLPEFNMLNGPLEGDSGISVLGKSDDSGEAVLGFKDDQQVVSRKGDSVIDYNSSRKRKSITGDVVHAGKKERRISDVMSWTHLNLPKDENETVGKAVIRKSTPLTSGKKRKAVDTTSDDLGVKNGKCISSPGASKPFLRIGDTISRDASQLAVATPILKYCSQKAVGENGNKEKRRNAIPVVFSSDEILSQLCLVARDPMKGYSFLTSVLSLFSDFRNSFCLENPNLRKPKKSSLSETSDTSEFEGAEDSYWTESETPNGNSAPTTEADSVRESSPRSDYKQDEKCEQEDSPTALILNFTDLDSVPSETNLNKIFNRYGPLTESETEVLKKSNRAKVVFKRRCDAETAFSSAGKFSIFGPSLISYRLNYSPSPRKTPTSAKKASRKISTYVEGDAV